jgi:poly(3-hydroxybutyrate) depolymerase
VKSKTKKIIVGLLAIVIGVPVALLLTAFACFYIMDKTNGAIISSGVTRRYLIYVPRIYDRSKAAPLVISMHPRGNVACGSNEHQPLERSGR